MRTFYIFQDGVLKATFENKETDKEAFIFLLRNQSQSTDWAQKHGGWKVEVKDLDSGLVTDYRTGEPVAHPLCDKTE